MSLEQSQGNRVLYFTDLIGLGISHPVLAFGFVPWNFWLSYVVLSLLAFAFDLPWFRLHQHLVGPLILGQCLELLG